MLKVLDPHSHMVKRNLRDKTDVKLTLPYISHSLLHHLGRLCQAIL